MSDIRTRIESRIEAMQAAAEKVERLPELIAELKTVLEVVRETPDILQPVMKEVQELKGILNVLLVAPHMKTLSPALPVAFFDIKENTNAFRIAKALVDAGNVPMSRQLLGRLTGMKSGSVVMAMTASTSFVSPQRGQWSLSDVAYRQAQAYFSSSPEPTPESPEVRPDDPKELATHLLNKIKTKRKKPDPPSS